jgi:hypothetical protein
LEAYFQRDIQPVLTPMAIDPAHPFPHIQNRQLYLAAMLKTKGQNRLRAPKNCLGIVPVPALLPRFIRVPPGGGKDHPLPPVRISGTRRRHCVEPTIDCRDLFLRLGDDELLVLDCREDGEWERYRFTIPGALKNAIDWASRPWGQNSFTRKPSAVIGTSPGKIGTAIAQTHLRSIMAFCNSPLMNSIEASIQFEPGLITDEGEVTNASTEKFLRGFMSEFHGFIGRVYTALPRASA